MNPYICTQKPQYNLRYYLKQYVEQQIENVHVSTHHDGNIMSVAERQRAITIHQILLYPHEAFEILWMITHHLKHMLQTIVLQENVH